MGTFQVTPDIDAQLGRDKKHGKMGTKEKEKKEQGSVSMLQK
jgi:hypothetical protein